MKHWRNKTNRYLFTRPIYKDEWPKLIEAMVEDGLVGILSGNKINWSNNGYSLTAKAVRDAWMLTDSQYRRLCDYVYSQDPFVYKE
jgi:hypothetical protein